MTLNLFWPIRTMLIIKCLIDTYCVWPIQTKQWSSGRCHLIAFLGGVLVPLCMPISPVSLLFLAPAWNKAFYSCVPCDLALLMEVRLTQRPSFSHVNQNNTVYSKEKRMYRLVLKLTRLNLYMKSRRVGIKTKSTLVSLPFKDLVNKHTM